jgi:crotonobetainyl-CoA:carnitine CoA-transferase CaiB-like acyl-CoA transferase
MTPEPDAGPAGELFRFQDLLVVETGTGLAGPMVSRVLRDLGARVVKIESRSRLDNARSRVPRPDMTPEQKANMTEIHPQVHELNAGKESVLLNLKTEEGRDLFLGLIESADVYVNNFAPGWLERIGLSLELMQARNPRLVAVSESAYGSTGPLSDMRAYAPIMTAMAGVESIVGYEDGRVVPQISSAIGDLVAAFYGVLLVLSGLYERRRTGLGAIIDMSQIEAAATMGGIMLASYGLTGTIPLPVGNSDPRVAPHGVYPVAGDDQWVAIAVWSDGEWRSLCAALGISDEARDQFETRESRLGGREDVNKLVAEATAQRERDELHRHLQSLGVSCTPVLDCDEAQRLPGFAARGSWLPLTHPIAGELLVTRVPWHFDHLTQGPTGPADVLGGSTEAVLRDVLDVDDETLARCARTSVFE